MANPFLFDGADVRQEASNPFLINEAVQPPANPFMDFGSTTFPSQSIQHAAFSQQNAQVNVNPFADTVAGNLSQTNTFAPNQSIFTQSQVQQHVQDQQQHFIQQNYEQTIPVTQFTQTGLKQPIMTGTSAFGVVQNKCMFSMASDIPKQEPVMTINEDNDVETNNICHDGKISATCDNALKKHEIDVCSSSHTEIPNELTESKNIHRKSLDETILITDKLVKCDENVDEVKTGTENISESVEYLDESIQSAPQRVEECETQVVEQYEQHNICASATEGSAKIDENYDLVVANEAIEINKVVPDSVNNIEDDLLNESEIKQSIHFDQNSESVTKENAVESKDNGFSSIFSPNINTCDEIKLPSDSNSNTCEPEINKETKSNERITGPSSGAALFELDEEPTLPIESNNEVKKNEAETPLATMSTGDAIFSDLPAVPKISSTGASIFGISNESAADTTGATLFGVTAPKVARPELGQMSGWDEAFDKKFESAVESGGDSINTGVVSTGGPFDPFGEINVHSIHNFQNENKFESDDFGAKSFTPSSTATKTKKTENLTTNPFQEVLPEDNEVHSDSPLYDQDTTQALEDFPRINYDGDGWDMFIRYPPKKKITAQRYWKKVYLRIVVPLDNPMIHLYESKDSKEPFQELPLQANYSVSEIAHQILDQYSKIFTLKLQIIFYKERAGIRPGQISKMQKLTGKISFLAKAVEDADYEGVKEFASDMKKLGVPLEHAPQITELLKIGCNSFEDLKQFTVCIEESLFRMTTIIRDRALTYKKEEVQLTAVDEIYVEQDRFGHIKKHICRIRVYFLAFLSGMCDVELGVNDTARIGLEVVGRHDILPVPTEQWIRYENIEFNSIVDKEEYENSNHIIKFRPPDGSYIELLRFRIRPPRCRELPMQARCSFQITGNKVEIRADMMIPYQHTKAWGQVPCEDVAMRIPIPECWIYQFRMEKHHISLGQLATGNLNLGTRMGSVKSAHRRAGKVKGLERFLGTLETQAQDLMETSSGQAKYEHQHKAIVWRVPRLPKQGQGSYTNHEFVCRLTLSSFDQMPEEFEKHFYVEFSQPATCISNTVLRSVSISGGESDEPAEKFVKYIANHEYKLEIEFIEKEQDSYLCAVAVAPKKNTVDDNQDTNAVSDSEFPDENFNKKSDSDSE